MSNAQLCTYPLLTRLGAWLRPYRQHDGKPERIEVT